MSDSEDLKQHEATEKRIQEMREQGKTLRSKDLSSAIIIFIAIMMIVYLSKSLVIQFESNYIISYQQISSVLTDPDDVAKILSRLMLNSFSILIPLFLMLIVACFASVFILGGWNFSIKSLKFDMSKLNPITNLGNIYSKKLFFDVAKSSVKFILIVSCLLIFIKNNGKSILHLGHFSYYYSLQEISFLLKHFAIYMCIAVSVIATIDAFYSYFTYQEKSKMSTQDVKDEQKNTEGNADVKRKLKSIQYSMMKQKIPQMVPQANVIITNPTHFAVALRYKEGKDKAPKVIAKGKGLIALEIKRIAIANNIPIYEEPPLARAIFHTSKLGTYINPELYMAVAMVLTYIHQLRRYQCGQAPMPIKADSLSIPKGFEFNSKG